MKKNMNPIIMIIEGETVVLNSLFSTLSAEYCTLPFKSGRQALSFLARETADIILLDCQMPDMTGFDILKKLQGNHSTKEIPTILFTNSIDSDNEIRAIELGAVDYITMPVRPELLITRIRLQLERLEHRKKLETLVKERTTSLNEACVKLKTREDVMLNMLAKVTDLRDHDTGGHIERTTEFVRVIVDDILKNPRRGYDISSSEADDIIHSSKLHDIGKIAMPDNVLLKKGKLTQEEFDIVKKHPTYGKQFLNDFVSRMNDSFLKTAMDIAYSHHEKWDGTGYPLGLKGYDIPSSARIVAISDVYDALTSRRPYKMPISHKESVKIILENSGTQFDPYLASIFRRHASKFQQIAEQIWSPKQQKVSAVC